MDPSEQDVRRLVADTAWRLFAERGFDAVSVADVAGRAGVPEAVVRAAFPAKEDLFFSQLDVFERRLLDAVAGRAKGESVSVAFRRHIVESDGGLLEEVAAGDTVALERLRTLNRVVAGSPALRAREREALAHCADALAARLAEEAGETDDLRARTVAHALIAVQRVLIDYARERVLADDAPERIDADVRRLGADAFRLLDEGLGPYGR